jgi:hypothetical protein
VVATSIASSPTLIHTGSSTASTFEEVWIYAQNNNSADVALRLGFGGVTDPDDIIEYTVKTKGGLYLIVPGLILKGNASAALTIRAAAATANVISLSGYVNRITA